MSQVMKEEQPVYHRILLKLSGESLGANGQSIDPDILSEIMNMLTILNKNKQKEILEE